ncbi:AtzE family amidohydrolase [Microcoleus sp. FACHB-1515]|uniref:AtzE family amidohydrolase n=1 Tax=Leptolyngbya sp. FACHB-1515 TaxID=2933931 RepID=UPI001682A8E8|nr:AtzE family amidohydrolase [Microcoleus sp. FACHB-1515]MBD2089656.1 AtzE family amidohydrolase [Microcoleus sp. FACHB-1515]
MNFATADAIAIAAAVRSQAVRAVDVTQAAIDRITASDLNCFTTVLAESALAQAAAVDATVAQGEDPGQLAGAPFAVKDLFDIAGVVTIAGSKINRDLPPATADAFAVAALKRAGAVLVGALTMDEYAYGFTTENHHYGAVRNPHDRTRIAGGSSGGSAAAVAGGLVPISLGSDTNGSIRVPASLCGILGLKPTYGRLSRSGAYLFCNSLDHIGPFARSIRDIALIFDLLQGEDLSDPVCTNRLPEMCSPQLDRGLDGLHIAVADGYFATGAEPEALAAVEQIAAALGTVDRVTLPEADRARAAAFIITACEGSNLHLKDLQTRPQDFDPATRDRFLAGAMIPASWYIQAQRFRQWYRDRVREVFESVDVILAPTTPCSATKIGQEKMTIAGVEMLVRPNLGMFTQPLSFIGLPVLSVPLQFRDRLPLGVQLIAAPYQEAKLLRAGAYLEAQGIISAAVASSF